MVFEHHTQVNLNSPSRWEDRTMMWQWGWGSTMPHDFPSWADHLPLGGNHLTRTAEDILVSRETTEANSQQHTDGQFCALFPPSPLPHWNSLKKMLATATHLWDPSFWTALVNADPNHGPFCSQVCYPHSFPSINFSCSYVFWVFHLLNLRQESGTGLQSC